MATTEGYTSIDGRTYHDETKARYILPTDTEETNRLRKQSQAIKITLGGLFTTPINEQLENGVKVLDAGCGPGAWSLDMGANFRNSQFYGVDILEKQFPNKKDTPGNVQFAVGNLAGSIPYPDNTFGFVHQRLLSLAFTSDQWKDNLKEHFRIMKPGGCIELIEYDHLKLLEGGPLMKKLQETVAKYLSSQGIPPYVSNELPDRVKDAGFVNVKNHVKKQIFCSLENEKEQLTGSYILHAFQGLGPRLASIVSEWKDAKVLQEYLLQCKIEAANSNVYLHCNVVTAQKPILDP